VVDVSRVTRTKAQARANYDRRSRWYEWIEGRFERSARVLGERLLAVSSGDDVLEVGSGPGESLATFARDSGRDARVIGIDMSREMHRVAAARLANAGLADAVSLLVADGATLPLRGRCVDAALMSFTLELFDTPELPTVLAEIRRVLSPQGRLVVVSLTTTDPPALMERAYLLAHRYLPRLADCRPIPVTDLLAEAGFVVTAEHRCDIVGIPVAVIASRPA
jgi:ubiquinone/menaquinone biosynthesis C-methylase UbiE